LAPIGNERVRTIRHRFTHKAIRTTSGSTQAAQEIIDMTTVAEQVRASGVAEGLALVSAMHITASSS